VSEKGITTHITTIDQHNGGPIKMELWSKGDVHMLTLEQGDSVIEIDFKSLNNFSLYRFYRAMEAARTLRDVR